MEQATGAARWMKRPRRTTKKHDEEGAKLDGKGAGSRLLKCHEVDSIGREVAEDNTSDAHGELGFPRGAILATNKRRIADHQLAGESRVRGKFHLNPALRARLRHIPLQ